MPKSTLQTAIAIANSLIGSATIILPLNYLKYGMIQNILFLILLGTILSTTCSVYAMHLRPSETQITQTIRRVLGQRFFLYGALLSGFMLVLVSCVFFLLPADIIYDVFYDFFGEQFFLSQKIFKLIILVLFACLTLFNDLNLVFKYAPYAMSMLIISTLTLLISLPFNIDNIDSSVIQPKQFSFSNLLLVASINSFAFTCHPSISPMLKQNKNQKNNRKSVYLGFTISGILYLIVGICGLMAIYHKPATRKNNVLDYFQGQWQAPVMGIANFIYFLLIFPIFPYISKGQLTSLLSQKVKSKPNFNKLKTLIFAIIFIVLSSFFILSQTSPGKVLGFIGSVVAFYFTFMAPVMIMFKAGKTQFTLLNEQNNNNQTIIKTAIIKQTQKQKSQKSQSLITQEDKQTLKLSQKQKQNNQQNSQIVQTYDNMTIKDKQYVIRHIPLEIKDKIVYGFIIIIGLILFVAELVDIVKGLFQ